MYFRTPRWTRRRDHCSMGSGGLWWDREASLNEELKHCAFRAIGSALAGGAKIARALRKVSDFWRTVYQRQCTFDYNTELVTASHFRSQNRQFPACGRPHSIAVRRLLSSASARSAPLRPRAGMRHNPSVEHSIPTDRFQRKAVTWNRRGGSGKGELSGQSDVSEAVPLQVGATIPLLRAGVRRSHCAKSNSMPHAPLVSVISATSVMAG